MPLSPELMEIVRCPKCLGKVVEKDVKGAPGLVCEKCRLVYAIVNDIPNFLVDEARPLE